MERSVESGEFWGESDMISVQFCCLPFPPRVIVIFESSWRKHRFTFSRFRADLTRDSTNAGNPFDFDPCFDRPGSLFLKSNLTRSDSGRWRYHLKSPPAYHRYLLTWFIFFSFLSMSRWRNRCILVSWKWRSFHHEQDWDAQVGFVLLF